MAQEFDTPTQQNRKNGPARRHLTTGKKVVLGFVAGTGALGLGAGIVEEVTGNTNLPPIVWVAPHSNAPTTHKVETAVAGTSTNTPETSPYATAEQVNQAIADMQKAAINNLALKKQLEQDAANVVKAQSLVGGKLGIFNGGYYADGAALGIFPKEAKQINKYTTVLLCYTEDSQRNIVVLPLLFTGNHTVGTNDLFGSTPVLSAQEITDLINNGILNHKMYFTMLGLTTGASNDSQLHQQVNKAVAEGLAGLKPMPTYDVANQNSLPNLDGGRNINLNFYTLEPIQS